MSGLALNLENFEVNFMSDRKKCLNTSEASVTLWF